TFSEDISSQLAAPKTGHGTSNLGVALRGARYPFVHHATSSRVVKGEDVMFTSALGIPDSTLFMVCDGHSGPEAATFVASHFLSFLSTRLPGSLPDFNSSNGK
ncbi:PPM-type phosphatase domain-containing protein, partial [Haematococcus lacustris]